MPQKILTIGAISSKSYLSQPHMTLDLLISKVKNLIEKEKIFEFDGLIVVQIGTNDKSKLYLSDKIEFLRVLLHSLFPFAESFNFKLPIDINK